MRDLKFDPIERFYRELKDVDSTKRTFETEMEGRDVVEIKNKGLLYYIIKEVKQLFPNGIKCALNAGGDLGIDLILMKENGISIKEAFSIDIFTPENHSSDFSKYVEGSIYNLVSLEPEIP